jgi:2-dehydropantoate 2-reductase
MVEWKPTIAVVGAGAMGCLFGGLLAEGGLDVTLIDVWQEHVDRINRDGLRIIGYGGDRHIPIRATTEPSGLEAVDVLFVQCKAPYTKEAVRRVLHLLREDSVAISFQNGLGNEEKIGAVIGMRRVLGGVTAQGAAVEGPGAVRNFGNLPTHIGEMPGGLSERSQRIAAALNGAGLQTAASSNIRQAIWKKLLANIAVSPTSAIANMTIKQVFDVPELKETAFEALDEAAVVARAEGVDLELAETHEVIDQIAGPEGTGDNKSSLCVDILNRRPCEVDVISGAIVRLGKQHGIPTPVNKTLVAAVKAMESHYLN